MSLKVVRQLAGLCLTLWGTTILALNIKQTDCKSPQEVMQMLEDAERSLSRVQYTYQRQVSLGYFASGRLQHFDSEGTVTRCGDVVYAEHSGTSTTERLLFTPDMTYLLINSDSYTSAPTKSGHLYNNPLSLPLYIKTNYGKRNESVTLLSQYVHDWSDLNDLHTTCTEFNAGAQTVQIGGGNVEDIRLLDGQDFPSQLKWSVTLKREHSHLPELVTIQREFKDVRFCHKLHVLEFAKYEGLNYPKKIVLNSETRSGWHNTVDFEAQSTVSIFMRRTGEAVPPLEPGQLLKSKTPIDPESGPELSFN